MKKLSIIFFLKIIYKIKYYIKKKPIFFNNSFNFIISNLILLFLLIKIILIILLNFDDNNYIISIKILKTIKFIIRKKINNFIVYSFILIFIFFLRVFKLFNINIQKFFYQKISRYRNYSFSIYNNK